MGAALGEHPPGMTYCCTKLSLTALLSLTCSLSLGCDAPEKTVGQETEGSTDSGSSGPDTEGCGGVVPCGTEGSNSGSGSESGSETDSTPAPENCGTFDNTSECQAEGCRWRETSRVSLDGSACEITDGPGACDTPSPGSGEDGCGGTFCDVDDNEYWVRELDDGTWNFVGGDCFQPVPDGFTRCEYNGDDPAACACLCPDDASLPDGFEPTLSGSGCADMTIFASSPDGSIGLGLSTGLDFNPVADAIAAGETVTTTHDVSEFARLVVMVGTNVTYPECNDALDPDAYSIDQEWAATAGTVEIVIVPDLKAPKFGTLGSATVTITDLEVTFDGVSETLEDITFTDVGVGWLPG